MVPIRIIFRRLRKLKISRKMLLIISFLSFFWTFFDGMLSYLVPILITQRGFTKTDMGLILAFSSIAGAGFDFILSRLLKKTNYLRLFLYILLISFSFPFFLWSSNNIFLYLFSMAVWGLYYDLYTYASYDFVQRNSPSVESDAFDFGLIELFRSTAGFLAPLLAALLIINGKLNFFNIINPVFFLVIAFIFYIILFNRSPIHFFLHSDRHIKPSSFSGENRLLIKMARYILPSLVFMTAIYIYDATFWTIGPLFSQRFPDFKYFSGILMTLYNLPSLITTWKIESLTRRFGKKTTAFFTFLLANLFLIPVGFLHSPLLVLFFIFLSSVASSITWPAIEAVFGDYVAAFPNNQSEIEALTDFTINLGYIFGPILAGIFSDKIGISYSFTILGIADFILVLLLYWSKRKSYPGKLTNSEPLPASV